VETYGILIQPSLILMIKPEQTLMKHYTVSHNILASNVSMGLKDLLYQIFL